MNYDYDYLDVDPNLDGTTNAQYGGFYYANHGTAANRPHLDFTTGADPSPGLSAGTYNNVGDEQVIFSNTIVVKKGLVKF